MKNSLRTLLRVSPQIICSLFAVTVLYVLSVGPAVWCMERGIISESAYENAYLPLVKCTSMIPPLYWLIDEYAVLWQ